MLGGLPERILSPTDEESFKRHPNKHEYICSVIFSLGLSRGELKYAHQMMEKYLSTPIDERFHFFKDPGVKLCQQPPELEAEAENLERKGAWLKRRE